MLLTPTQSRLLLQHAFEQQYAILAVNADSHSAVTDCLEAARLADAPLIIETSLWQIKGHGYGYGDAVLGIARYLADLMVLCNSDRFRHLPVIYHTDHIKGPETLGILQAAIQGIEINFQEQVLRLSASTISLDASDLSENQNIQHMLQLCAYAEAAGVDLTLEMESAVDDGITPPDETKRLIGAVEEKYPGKIALWAPGLGTQHGFTSDDGYSGFQTKTIETNVRLLQQLTGRNIGIALHGSTGLSPEKLSRAAKCGVTKVNWSSESLYLRSVAAQQYYREFADRFDRKHPEWKNTVMDNGLNSYISKIYIPKVLEKICVLGAEGKARYLQL